MRRVVICISLIFLLLTAACADDGADQQATGEAGPAEQATEGEQTAGGDQAADEGQTEPAETATEAAAEDGDCSELEGSTITFVVPYDAGGGYDQYARLIGPALAEEIGATVVVDNQPGAGGLLAINNLLRAPTDGTTIAVMNAVGSGGAVIADAEGVQFELDQLSYIARITDDRPLLVTHADSEFQTFQDMLDAESIRMGSNGPGAQDFISSTVLNAMFEDLDGEIITGFDGSKEIALTLQQGQLDAFAGSVSSRLPSVEAGDERPLLLLARERVEQLPDIPTVLELDLDQRQQELAEAYLSLLELGRAIVAPPDVPEGPLNCLRTATREVLTDEELIAQAEQQGRPIEHRSGEDLDELVANLSAAPEEFQQVIRDAH